jgi:dolichol-phosphate mannosyltransferase
MMSDFKLEPGTTDYRLLDRKVVNYFVKFAEKNRLYRWLTDRLWFDKKVLIFNAKQRLDWWEGSYTYKNLFKLAVNSLTSFSLFPLKLIGYLGTFISFSSVLMLAIIIIDKAFFNYFGFTNLSIILVLNTTLMWIVLVWLGFIAHYIGKIHEEVLWRPMYIVSDRLNFKNDHE